MTFLYNKFGGTIGNYLCKMINKNQYKKILLISGVAAGFSLEVSSIGSLSYDSMLPAIACFIMYLELFGSVNMIFAMSVCIISVIISEKRGIYSSQLWVE